MAGRPPLDETRVSYSLRLPMDLLDRAKDAAAHYGMSVTDVFTLSLETTIGQLEDRDGPIPPRAKTGVMDVSDLAEALRERANKGRRKR